MFLPLTLCLSGCVRPQSPASQPLTNPAALNAVVWAKKLSGIYYCRGSATFGQGPGSYMKQAKALDSGYQPEFGAYCIGREMPKVINHTEPAGITSFSR
jgi:hypothetical protein